MSNIDLLLAQKYAGAAGKARRAVTIEWDKVEDLTPWRYGLAIGVGLEPPDKLLTAAGVQYSYTTALAPMVSLQSRAAASDRACAAGILSNAAIVDLYSQIYADTEITGELQERAEALRDAYTLESPAARLAAMQTLWSGGADEQSGYARRVLTAAAAARVPATEEFADSAAGLIASMLAAGYDANAIRWSSVVENGSPAWGLLALVSPGAERSVDTGDLDRYVEDDASENKRKAAFLVAGLAGLGRLDADDATRYSRELALGMGGSTRWTTAIDRAPDGRHGRWLSGFRRDLLVAARALAQARSFSALAVATLALGIGATTAIFAAVDTILLRPMPYAHADRLVVPISVNPSRNLLRGSISFADYQDWREERRIFHAIAAWRPVTVDLTEHGEPERAEAAQVTEDFFRLAETTFIAGRAARLAVAGEPIGILGEVHPEVLTNFGLTYPVALAELKLERVF